MLIVYAPAAEGDHHYSADGFALSEILDRRAFEMRKRRKRVRTRAALIAAALRELERVGYEALTVEGISEAAGMTRGTFYLYYRSRSDIMSVIIRFYWALLLKYRPRGGNRPLQQQSIHRANYFLVHCVAKNAPLLLAREMVMVENRYLARRLIQINDRWADQIVHRMVPAADLAKDPEFHRLRARAVIGMSDMLLRDIYRSASLEASVALVNHDLIVRVLDDLWLRFMTETTGDSISAEC